MTHIIRGPLTLAAMLALLGGGALAQSGSAGTTPPSGSESGGWKAPDDPNANPQQAIERGEIDENSVKSLLQSKGYNDVRQLRRDGGDFRAHANKDGREVSVKVHGRSGRIEEVGG